MAAVRGPSVDYNSSNATQNAVGWVNFTLPLTYVAGDPVAITFTGGVLSDGVFPTDFEAFGSGFMLTVNGGVVGAGPYSGSGDSYAPGVTQKNWPSFSFGTSWLVPGLGQSETLPNGGGANSGGYVLVDGSGVGFAGEGMVPVPPSSVFGVVGWAPDISTTAAQLPLTTNLHPGDAVTWFIQMSTFSYDSVNPARTVYPVITGLSVNAGGVDTALDLATMHVGFNSGGSAVPNYSGPANTYNAWRAVEAITPPASTDHSDFYLITIGGQRGQGYIF